MADSALAAVIGSPVAHSLSPEIFTWLSRATGKPVDYRRLEVAPARLSELTRAVSGTGLFVGWNVTLPHKESIVALLDHVSPEAQALGAANVVHFGKVQTVGHNTDVLGVRETLREQKFRAAGKSAILYGAGGAAKAVAYALGQEKAAEVWVWSRTRDRANLFCQRFAGLFPQTRFQVADHPDSAGAAPSLLVNATPVGLKGYDGELVLPIRVAHGALAFDLIYRPARTAFLRKANGRKLRTVGGLDMLIWQALATWEIWFHRLPKQAALKARLAKHLSAFLKEKRS